MSFYPILDSSLRVHMLLRHLNDDVNCICGHPLEDKNHSFIYGPLYGKIRGNTIRILTPNITVMELLSGVVDDTVVMENTFKFLVIYVEGTKRFE